MAQLRDAQTSELLADGDPRDLIIIADRIGADRVLWDDVGAVDIDVLREHNAQRLEVLEALETAEDLGDELKAERARQAGAAELAPAVDAVLESAQDPDRPTLEPVDVAVELEAGAGD